MWILLLLELSRVCICQVLGATFVKGRFVFLLGPFFFYRPTASLSLLLVDFRCAFWLLLFFNKALLFGISWGCSNPPG